MPYIKNDRRENFKKEIEAISISLSKLNKCNDTLCAGDLNYIITAICHEYIRTKGMNYQTFNDIMGALSGVDKELYRTVIGPYEEVKRIQNGRVSDIEG